MAVGEEETEVEVDIAEVVEVATEVDIGEVAEVAMEVDIAEVVTEVDIAEVVVEVILEEAAETSEVEGVEASTVAEVEDEVVLGNREGTWPFSSIFSSNLI